MKLAISLTASMHESALTDSRGYFCLYSIEMFNTYLEPVAKRILLMANILSTVRIDKLVVPEVVSNDCSSVTLDCVYSGAGDDVTVRWMLNGSQVYEWREGMEPNTSGVLTGRLDSSHKTSMLHPVQRQTLRLIELIPEMSGDYTCVVQSRGQEAQQTKNMIVFSPEHDFELTFIRTTPAFLNIKCIAKQLFPQPDLTIEYNRTAIPQQQRIWRVGSFYDAECTAGLEVRYIKSGEVACRLKIPQVDYTVITKKFINLETEKSGTPALISSLISLQIILVINILNFLSLITYT